MDKLHAASKHRIPVYHLSSQIVITSGFGDFSSLKVGNLFTLNSH